SIAFTKSDYVVYGYFYYNDGKKQMNPYKADLFSYLPEGTDLRFFAPSFKFDVTSNIGIPFVFDLDTITSYVHGAADPNPVKVNLQNDSVINRASNPTADATSTITINKTSFPDNNASSIFNTSLDSLSAAYTFKAPEKGSALIKGEQFIAPNSRIKMTASAQLPFWLDEGSVIAYADTLDGIDVEDYEYITNASLIFTYTSQLPLGFDITIALLDSSKNEISVKNPNNYKHSIKAAPVDGDGKVKQGSSAPQGSFTISYDSSTIEDLKKAKFLVVNVKAQGAASSKIKITNNDKLSIKAGLTVEGGLTVKN
ncbi:MAG: hypothetical protein LBT94_09705, partial [Prevotellaceae bacterium]|nr:hypothetical protein [Prevotellaceae bacterium]